MLSRRQFLGTLAAGISAGSLPGASWPGRSLLLAAEPPAAPRRKLAVVTTVWTYRSHAWHMAERFLHGYPFNGKWHRPAFEVVAAYVDQKPEGDLSRARAEEFGFQIYPSIAEALRCGGEKLAVDAVLIIGEHGDYPVNDFGQKEYPRYQFFKQVADVFRKDGRTAPVFNDKHLSWKFEWGREMIETSKSMKFGFCAGSSLPVTWRMPSIDMPLEAEIEEMICLAHGGLDSYDFHALEVLQCMAERRKGGETGVAAMHALRGDAVWAALESHSWKGGGWDAQLFESCIARTQTLAQPISFSDRRPTPAQMREFVRDPVAYRYEYADGLKATMLLMNGLVEDFTFAARLKGKAEPLSTLFYLPPNPNVTYSAALMSKAEETFMTGKAPYPVERTLLTGALVEAGLHSLAGGQKRIETPHLAIRYEPTRASTFSQS
jgi:hypothetical protein